MTEPTLQHARGVLDTNTVIVLPHLEDSALLPVEPLITAVTLAELSVGPLVASSDAERVRRQAHLQQAETDFDPLPFDARAARTFGRVAASLRQAGRKTDARAYDAMIAAMALANDLPVYTCNPDDFAEIEGLEVVAVPVPERSDRRARRMVLEIPAGSLERDQGARVDDHAHGLRRGRSARFTRSRSSAKVSSLTSPASRQARNASARVALAEVGQAESRATGSRCARSRTRPGETAPSRALLRAFGRAPWR